MSPHTMACATTWSLRILPILALSIVMRWRRRRRNQRKLQKRAQRKFWVRPWLLRREIYGNYESLMQELAAEDIPGYIAFQRICPEIFQELLELVAPRIEKQTTHWRKPIPPGVRLALTLRYLATGIVLYQLLFFKIHMRIF